MKRQLMNPYESPVTQSQPPKQTASGQLKAMAVLLWVLGGVPTVVAVSVFVTRKLPGAFNPHDMGVWLGLLGSLLPLVGFGLLGTGIWRRSNTFVAAAIVVLVAYMAVVAGAFWFGYIR